MDRRDRVD
jgi:hypothetical protein